MGVTIGKKAGPKANENAKNAEPEKTKAPSSLFKTGKQAQAAIEKEKEKAEARKEGNFKAFRFFLKEGEEKTITFLDGDLDPDTGLFNQPFLQEHQAFLGGKWNNFFACVSDEEPCPLCEDAGDKSKKVGFGSIVCLFTVIDHSPYTSPSTGKTYENTVKLFAAKRQTLMQLQKNAQKQGGSLAGCTFEVGRSSDKAANVGDVFIFEQKNDLADIRETFEETDSKGEVVKAIEPLNYEEEVVYKTAAELRAMGFGEGTVAPVPSSDNSSDDDDDDGQNYSDQM